jgi:hypothetical protein
MSVDVRGQNGEEVCFSNLGWAALLNFAIAYGWHPAGTIAPPSSKDWDGSYDPAQGQTVSASDAGALAHAISKALDAPDRCVKSRDIAIAMSREAGRSIREFDFSPKSVEHWKRLFQIAKKGEFMIS